MRIRTLLFPDMNNSIFLFFFLLFIFLTACGDEKIKIELGDKLQGIVNTYDQTQQTVVEQKEKNTGQQEEINNLQKRDEELKQTDQQLTKTNENQQKNIDTHNQRFDMADWIKTQRSQILKSLDDCKLSLSTQKETAPVFSEDRYSLNREKPVIAFQGDIITVSDINEKWNHIRSKPHPLLIRAGCFKLEEGEIFNTDGHDLYVMAGKITIHGTIRTTPSQAKENEPGAPAGTIHLLGTKIEFGPSANLDVSGGDAGENKYVPTVKLTEDFIKRKLDEIKTLYTHAQTTQNTDPEVQINTGKILEAHFSNLEWAALFAVVPVAERTPDLTVLELTPPAVPTDPKKTRILDQAFYRRSKTIREQLSDPSLTEIIIKRPLLAVEALAGGPAGIVEILSANISNNKPDIFHNEGSYSSSKSVPAWEMPPNQQIELTTTKEQQLVYYINYTNEQTDYKPVRVPLLKLPLPEEKFPIQISKDKMVPIKFIDDDVVYQVAHPNQKIMKKSSPLPLPVESPQAIQQASHKWKLSKKEGDKPLLNLAPTSVQELDVIVKTFQELQKLEEMEKALPQEIKEGQEMNSTPQPDGPSEPATNPEQPSQ